MHIVDAHEDIAWDILALGRDLLRSAWETRRLEEDSPVVTSNGRCMLGLPEWLDGGVTVVIGSLFLPPRHSADNEWSRRQAYADADEAHRIGMTHLDAYHRLAERAEAITLLQSQTDLEAVLAAREQGLPRLGIVVSMEGADPIREPGEVEEWFARGVRGVGLTWAAGSRYAGGNNAPGPLSDAGRTLLPALAQFNMLLDLAHMAEEAFWEALERYDGPVAVTHANPRAFVPTPRQLSDPMIRALAERDGVMGIVPYNRFLKPGWSPSDGKEAATLQDVAAAIDHVCQVVGDAAHVGLGSDFDGGFGAEATPAGLETVADLGRIAAALEERGYAEADIAAVMGGNWLRLLRRVLL
jgi:membrane dipeptidase